LTTDLLPFGRRYGEHCDDLERELIAELPTASFRRALRLYDILLADPINPNAVAYAACNDRFFLATAILRRHDILGNARKGEWLYERCREVEEDPDDYLDLWARYHYKSSIITFAGSIQEIIRDPEITIAIFSVTIGVARPFLDQIKTECETNEDMLLYFPDVFWDDPANQAPEWSKTRLVVKRQGNPKEGTVEAFGLLRALPPGRHFMLRIYDDVINETVVTQTQTDQIKKVTTQWELSQNLGGAGDNRKWHVGTRYCTAEGTTITMSDWSQRRIEDVRPGEKVIGWELRDGKRWLVEAAVRAVGGYKAQPVNRCTFDNGRSVVATAEHRWWRGAHGSGPEYNTLAMPGAKRRAKGMRAAKGQSHVRQVMVPATVSTRREAAWLAGFFDGEGTVKKNKNHPSGLICMSQTMHNPELIDEVRRVLTECGFGWTEAWHDPSTAEGQESWSRRCTFNITGGWRERYRFIAEIAPVRRDKIAATLLGQLTTEKLTLESIEPAGEENVYWLETETGNYIAAGIASSNSYADTYGDLILRNVLKVRLYPATDNGKLDGEPVMLSHEDWEKAKLEQRSVIAAQMLQNPLAATEQTFLAAHLRPYQLRPKIMNVYILVDPSKGRGRRSDRAAMMVLGIDPLENWYLLDGFVHRMKLSERYTNLKMLHAKWKNAPGVKHVRVGYERYGQQTDDEYIKERLIADKIFMDIVEVAWTNDGSVSKNDRIERLEPLFKNSRFWLPPKVWIQGQGDCSWWIDEESQRPRYRPLITPEARDVVSQINRDPTLSTLERDAAIRSITLTKQDRNAIKTGETYRVMHPIKRMNEDREPYDVTAMFFNEYLMHPFAPYDDAIDAAARLFDVEATPPASPKQMEELIPLEIE